MADSTSSPEVWLARVASAQRARATPEQLESMKRRSEQMRKHKVMAKKASRVHQSLSLSSSAWMSSVQEVASAPARSAEVGRRGISAMAALSSPEFMSPVRERSRGREETLEEMEEEEAELEQALNAVARRTVGEGTLRAEDLAMVQTVGGEAAQAAQQSSLEAALHELKSEPTDEDTCAAKFELYVGFAKLTEDARAATLEMWEQSQSEFDEAPATKAAIAREIQQVDRPENLGIHDNPRHWFVHSMCAQAARNQSVLNGVLSGISTKLELLASQTECPVCLEAFDSDRPSTKLGCAHAVCTECWEHWCAMSGGRVAICPLCRHEEFFERVLAAAEAGGA